MADDERVERLARIAVELIGERFGPGRLRRPKVRDEAAVIAERQRILVGGDGRSEKAERARAARLAAAQLRRDRKLAGAIRRWSA